MLEMTNLKKYHNLRILSMSNLLTAEGWGNKYTHLAKEISTWSKDPSTKVGAIVVGEAGQILSQGYNGSQEVLKIHQID